MTDIEAQLVATWILIIMSVGATGIATIGNRKLQPILQKLAVGLIALAPMYGLFKIWSA